MANKFMMPKTVWIGKDALNKAENDICKLGTKSLIISGKSMIRQGHIQKLTDILDKNKVKWEIFSEIPGEPTDDMIQAGAKIYEEHNCDFIIGFGGGSPLDSAKAIGILVSGGGNISDYLGKEINFPIPPIVAIPSTAGTGSEVTQFTIITDTRKNIKMLLKGSSLIPAIAVVDPEFTLDTPRNVTVAAGLDALTHAVEAYTSRKAYDQTDMYALSAVKRIFRYLPLVLEEPKNPDYREQMAIAAYEAGVSFNNSSVTLVHGMSRPIGALFHVPHGLSNAMLLDVCFSYALDGAYDKFGILGRAINSDYNLKGDKESAHYFLEALRNLCENCTIPTLEEYGIDKKMFFKQLDKMAEDAMESGSPSNTIKYIDKRIIMGLYEVLWKE